jgi:ATP-binding cassette subfamily F protein uup
VLERLGFPPSRQWTPGAQLSGGERRPAAAHPAADGRAERACCSTSRRTTWTSTPSPHLEDLLDGWPGTLVVVSHDRYLVERACDTVVALLGDGPDHAPAGGIDEYLARRAAPATRRVDAARRPRRRPGRRGSRRRSSAARKDAQRLERRMETLSAREEKLHAQLAEAATDPDRLLALDAELAAVVAEREQVELDWLAAAELAES